MQSYMNFSIVLYIDLFIINSSLPFPNRISRYHPRKNTFGMWCIVLFVCAIEKQGLWTKIVGNWYGFFHGFKLLHSRPISVEYSAFQELFQGRANT